MAACNSSMLEGGGILQKDLNMWLIWPMQRVQGPDQAAWLCPKKQKQKVNIFFKKSSISLHMSEVASKICERCLEPWMIPIEQQWWINWLNTMQNLYLRCLLKMLTFRWGILCCLAWKMEHFSPWEGGWAGVLVWEEHCCSLMAPEGTCITTWSPACDPVGSVVGFVLGGTPWCQWEWKRGDVTGGQKPGRTAPEGILILYSKTIRWADKQDFTEAYMAAIKLFRAMIHCFSYFSVSFCFR